MEVVKNYYSIYNRINDPEVLKLFKASYSFTRISQFLAGLFLQPITSTNEKNPMILAFSKLLVSNIIDDSGSIDESFINDDDSNTSLINLSSIISFLILLDVSTENCFPLNEDFILLKKLLFSRENRLEETNQNVNLVLIENIKNLNSDKILKDIIENSSGNKYLLLRILLSFYKLSDFDQNSHQNFLNIINKFFHICGINQNIVFRTVNQSNSFRNRNGEILNAFIFDSYTENVDLEDVYEHQINGDDEEEDDESLETYNSFRSNNKKNVFYAILRKRGKDGSSIGPFIGAYIHKNKFFYYDFSDDVSRYRATTITKEEFNVIHFIAYDSDPVFAVDRSNDIFYDSKNMINDSKYNFLREQLNNILENFGNNNDDSTNNCTNSISTNSSNDSVNDSNNNSNSTNIILSYIYNICSYALTPVNKSDNNEDVDSHYSILMWMDAACCLMEIAPLIFDNINEIVKEVAQLVAYSCVPRKLKEIQALTMVLMIQLFKKCHGTGEESNKQGSDIRFLPRSLLKCNDIEKLKKYIKIPKTTDKNVISNNVKPKKHNIMTPSFLVDDFLLKYNNYTKFPEFDCEALYKDLLADGIHYDYTD